MDEQNHSMHRTVTFKWINCVLFQSSPNLILGGNLKQMCLFFHFKDYRHLRISQIRQWCKWGIATTTAKQYLKLCPTSGLSRKGCRCHGQDQLGRHQMGISCSINDNLSLHIIQWEQSIILICTVHICICVMVPIKSPSTLLYTAVCLSRIF